MKTHTPYSHHQSGQAIVLIALLMVTLIASLGLAIDGGGMFLLHRDVQNATDAAALSAAFALCTGGDPVAAGLSSAKMNGFDNEFRGVNVQINNPPIVNTEYAGDDTKVEVIIVSEKPSYFIQVVYDGPLVVSADTVSQCDGSPATATNVVNRYAFRSLASPDECTQTTSWNIAGTRWTLEGDIWMPNVSGNVQLNNNQPNADIIDNPIDILGNIYIGGSKTDRFNDQHDNLSQGLNEDLPTSAAGASVPGYTGYGGDGVIEYDVPEPDPLPFTMDYFRPIGSSLCTTSECGTLQSMYPSQYHDISHGCDHGAVNKQDFIQNADTFGHFYNKDTSTWEDGIYYSECQLQLNDNNMKGNVSFITEENIDLSNQPYNMIAFGSAPLFVSNVDNRRGNPQQCSSGGSYAIQLNANQSYFKGAIIAFRGTVFIQGNGFIMETCISAMGFAQNGNTNAVYRCLPGEASSIQTFAITE